MGKSKFFLAIFMITVLSIPTVANSALVGRLAATLGGTDYQAYYDDVLNVTWLADANAASGSIYDDGASQNDGKMSWGNANAWAASLSINGVTGWRLPTMQDTGSQGCNYSETGGTDCGYNVQTGSVATKVYSEVASLYSDTLGNLGAFDSDGNVRSSGAGLLNTGLFSNLQNFYYWYGLEYSVDTGKAWNFSMGFGLQIYRVKLNNTGYALGVYSGDVSAVPVPAAVWLFGSGLLCLLGFAGRKKT